MTDRMPPSLPPELHDLLDGRLDPDAADAVRARIASDPAWAEAWAELQHIQGWVRAHGAEHEPPAALRDGIRRRIAALDGGDAPAEAATDDTTASVAAAAEPAARAQRPSRFMRILTLSYASAALLVVGFTVAYVFMLDGDRAPGTLSEERVDTADGVMPPKPANTGSDEPAGSIKDPQALDGLGEESLGDKAFGANDARSTELGKVREQGKQAERGESASGSKGFQPGGVVEPGLRRPTDEPALAEKKAPAPPRARAGARPATDAKSGDAAGAGDVAKDADGAPGFASSWGGRDVLARVEQRMEAGDIVYVIETDDPAATRAALVAMLKTTTADRSTPSEGGAAPEPSSVGIGGGARGRAGSEPAPTPKPAAAPPAPGASAPPPPAAPAAEAPADAPANKNDDVAEAEALYRLAAGEQVAGLRTKLDAKPTPTLALFAEIDRPLTDEAVALLEARVLAAQLASRQARVKKAKRASPPEAKAESERATEDEQDEAEEDEAKEDAGDAPAANAPAKRKAPATRAKPKRLRILILERK